MIVYEKPAEYRGTIEVYADDHDNLTWDIEWRWRCRSRNNTILASGEGYKRRSGALNAIDAQYAARLSPAGIADSDSRKMKAILPWRLVIHDRHGTVERIGAVY
ncbi:hypothetical protein SEA_MCKLOVIN_57 [Gordonia phage Mcklovin]|uniref:DUF1508 domain-containing protein n=1 Tax=Gordonia phage Mcklovin TaxID=2652881 RepID=A0A5P8DEK4_9CAUD|nr:hypothetical protein PP514_gp57 [Gordonia phage Mcklovin]QFP96842.1 hypothetical protein SEA_MCKLOVIN_57 [Gordonia phage Mcklovin]